MHYKLFSCVLITKGASKFTLVDVQRHEVFAFSNIYFEVFCAVVSKPIVILKEKLTKKKLKLANEILEFLNENELGFYTKNPESFPEISMEWERPEIITNAIIEINENNNHFFLQILGQLLEFGCKFFEFRIQCGLSFSKLNELLQHTEDKLVRNIDIHAQVSTFSLVDFSQFFRKNQRVGHLYLYGAQEDDELVVNHQYIVVRRKKLFQNSHCGITNLTTFNSTLDLFTESHHHNSCLNCKISIDTEGNIKNCPSMAQSFGNIKDTTLQEALDHPEFKKYWNVTKDQIAVCKDCEFRYICTDCRAYTENPEDMYAKPLKCGYNPYTCEWEEWSTNPLKQKAIDYYGMREVLPEFQMKDDYVPPPSDRT